MKKELVIVFVKNLEKGKVKTRLAKIAGEEKAFGVYAELLKITEIAVSQVDSDVLVLYSDKLGRGFEFAEKGIQIGEDLGRKMFNAFQDGFQKGYKKIVLIGSDLPDLKAELISESFKSLDSNDFVLGPSEDGGYYLVGMNQLKEYPFQNKKWSTKGLMEETEKEISDKKNSLHKLKMLNDIDTWEDYLNSSIYRSK